MQSGTNPHVLIVDDNAFATQIFTRKLESQGYRVTVRQSGRECLTFMQTEVPDVVLLDLMMPGIDGFSVLKLAMNRKELKGVPFIILSGKDHPSDRQKAFALGAVDYLVKTKSDCNDVVAKVRSALLKKQGIAEAPTYRLAVQESTADSQKFCEDFGVANRLRCKACQGKLLLELTSNETMAGDSFVARLYCATCEQLHVAALVEEPLRKVGVQAGSLI